MNKPDVAITIDAIETTVLHSDELGVFTEVSIGVAMEYVEDSKKMTIAGKSNYVGMHAQEDSVCARITRNDYRHDAEYGAAVTAAVERALDEAEEIAAAMQQFVANSGFGPAEITRVTYAEPDTSSQKQSSIPAFSVPLTSADSGRVMGR
jgi:hypothetical protein